MLTELWPFFMIGLIGLFFYYKIILRSSLGVTVNERLLDFQCYTAFRQAMIILPIAYGVAIQLRPYQSQYLGNL